MDFLPIFLTSLAVTETFPILSNLSIFRRTGQAGMSNFRNAVSSRILVGHCNMAETGCEHVRVLENLKSPGIFLWHFPELEKKAAGPGKFWKSVKLK